MHVALNKGRIYSGYTGMQRRIEDLKRKTSTFNPLKYPHNSATPCIDIELVDLDDRLKVVHPNGMFDHF